MTVPGYYTDAAPSRQQLRALAARGFPLTWVAEQIGMSTSGVQAIRSGLRAQTGTYAARALDRLYRRVEGTTPAQHGIPPRSIHLAYLDAGRNGWTAS